MQLACSCTFYPVCGTDWRSFICFGTAFTKLSVNYVLSSNILATHSNLIRMQNVESCTMFVLVLAGSNVIRIPFAYLPGPEYSKLAYKASVIILTQN